MAEDIVTGLFGLTPQAVEEQRRAAAAQDIMNFQNLDLGQQSAYLAGQAGYGLGRKIGGMLGMVDPLVEQAKMRQAILANLDPNDPESYLKVAKVAQDSGDVQTAMRLKIAANDLEYKKAQALALLAEKQPQSIKEYGLAKTQGYKGSFLDFKKDLENKTNLPASIDEYNYAVSQGYKGSLLDYKKDVAASGKSSVEVKLPEQERGFESELGKKQAVDIIESRGKAEDAVQIINTVNEGKNILDSGIISGFGADFIVGLGMALRRVGIDFGGNEIENTQAFTANMAQNVGKLIKQFGAGTGLSDADRTYAEKMAGGKVSIDEKAIRKILDINDRAARNSIKAHNRKIKGIKTNIPLEVEEPNALGKTPSGMTLIGKTPEGKNVYQDKAGKKWVE